MLETLRKSATGWVAKIFIGLLVISFAIWGIADIFRGYGATTAATVGETEIPSEAFRLSYNRELRSLGLRLRRPITAQEAVAVGLPNQVLSILVNDAVLNEEARKLQLGLSDEKLAAEIRSDPDLRGPDGRFDRQRFRDLLYNNGINEDYYTLQQRQRMLRQQLSGAVTNGVVAPTAYLEALNQYQNETRVIKFVTLDPAAAGEIANPSADALAKFYDERKIEFRAPEYRKFVYLSVDPKALADPQAVSEDNILAAYENAGTKYLTPEKRSIRQIVFPSPEEANSALQKIRGGASFDQIMTERDLKASDVDLGLISKAEVIDPAVGDVAFSLEKSAVSDVIEGRFGSIIVEVVDIQEEKRTPIEEVRDALAAEVAVKLAEDDVLKLHDDIEDARAGGATIAEVAGRFRLDAVTVDAVDRAGKAPDGSTVTLPESAQLLKAVFESDVGVENDPLHQTKGFLWYDVLDVTAARDRTLEEAAEDVVARWLKTERDSRLGARATTLLERVKTGVPLDVISAELNTEVKTSPELKRNTPAEGVAPAIVAAAFSGPNGHVTSVKLSDDSRVILQITDVTSPTFFAEAADVMQIKERLTAQLENTVLSQYVARLREEIGVEVNETAVARAIGIQDLQ